MMAAARRALAAKDSGNAEAARIFLTSGLGQDSLINLRIFGFHLGAMRDQLCSPKTSR